MEEIEMEHNKIYFISFGGNTQLVGRFKEISGLNFVFYDLLHYWNGSETFRKNDHCIKSGITEFRRASKAEKHALIRFEIDNDLI